LIGIRGIKRLTDERLIEVRGIVEGDGVGLIEGVEGGSYLPVSFDGYKKEIFQTKYNLKLIMVTSLNLNL